MHIEEDVHCSARSYVYLSFMSTERSLSLHAYHTQRYMVTIEVKVKP